MNDLFLNISEKNKEKLLKKLNASTVKYPKGVNTLSNVNRKNYIGMVDYGSLQINLIDYDGNSVILDELEQYDILGSIIYPISDDGFEIITKEETTITYIDYEEVINLEGNNSDYFYNFIRNFLTLLGQQINIKNERIKILTKRSTRDKLLEYFNIISKKQGTKNFTIPFTYTDLANYLCVDRSAMTREIKYLKNEGFIETDGKKIRLNY
ncbi:MAG: Crp/Fnr family transcriptional regulator [Candidatus Coprovivens sp.]